MKTGVIISIIAIVFIVVIGGFFLMKGFYSTNTNSNSGNNLQTPSGGSINPANTVNIENFAFSPGTLTIKVGQTVTWTNKDSTSHTVTSDSGNELISSTLSNSQTYTHTFNSVGTFNYHCSIHTSMKASIIVIN